MDLGDIPLIKEVADFIIFIIIEKLADTELISLLYFV